MMWLSYIVPLYNAEKYIRTCLDSLLNQGLEQEEYEVIVVNDGSTDDGPEIVETYCHRYSNFHLISKANCGKGSARNYGMQMAQGDYIHFMDADDYLLPKGMQILREFYLCHYNKYDMITFRSHTVDKYYDTNIWEHIHPHKIVFNGSFLEYGNRIGIGWNCWSQIISRKLITNHTIKFDSYVIGEDTMFMLSLHQVTDAVVLATNLNIYRYCVRENSALTRIDSKHLKSAFIGFLELYKKICIMQQTSLYREEKLDEKIKAYQREAFTRLCSGRFSYSEIKKMLDEAIKENFYPILHPMTIAQKFINGICHYPVLVYAFSILFRSIFIPYIKPYIKRN